ncbi:ABC transporter ATP-binding protein [Nocardia sp. NPDC058058]|uniref:ABC transporter ATP-binding protein n=1 Tax=Nocardia sp. NPDC058058 TaxID=3346317 RepID=UPI0036DB8AD2
MIADLAAILGRPHRGKLRTFLSWAIGYGVLQGLSVVFLLPIARALHSGDYGTAWRWLAGAAACAALCCLAHYRQAMAGFEVALTLLRTMHLRVGDHLVKLPLGWFGPDTVGRAAQIASKGTLSVSGAAAHLLTPVVTGVATPATIVLCLLVLDWRLGAVLLVCAPLIWLAARWSARLLADADEIAHHAAVRAGNRVLEYARCQPVLRAFGRTSRPYEPLDDAIEAQRSAGRATMWAAVVGAVATGVALQLTFTALIVAGTVLALRGDLGAIELIALLGVTARFVQPLSEVGELGGAVRMARAELGRMAAVLAESPLPEPDSATAAVTPGTVEFDHVRFGYTSETPVLQDISFQLAPGTLTALVGPSGSGKTTVTRLIARFYDVDSGVVRVGGVDVRDQSTAELMGQLALVFQDVYLFDDTLEANIRVGREDATDEQLHAAARMAGVEEIVRRLPDGWNTRVGEAGSALSGGERQRVSIARALLKDAQVVLLDEATAALDPENETYVRAALGALRSRSTLLVIAHQLSTVTSADRIIVLDAQGHVAETGTHTELLARDGRYRDFWTERERAAGWRLAAGR